MNPQPQKPPRIRFAMLTYGALDATQRCIRSLARHTPAPFELYVLDNASSDETPRWLDAQTWPWLHVRHNPTNRGVPGGRNDLLAFVLPDCADDDWIVFVDNDLEFGEGWLEPFVRAIHEHPAARVFGKVGHFVVVGQHRRTLCPAPTTTAPVDAVSGGYACFVRADAARAIGAFDERLGMFWHEDDDYCVRALQQGFDVVAVPEAAIEHHEHASGVATPDLEDGGSLQNQRYLADKWRALGAVDRDGWIVRQGGPYVPPAVRDAIARRAGRATPLGRTELAAAIGLLERLVDQPDPTAWFDRHRQPIAPCTAALLALHRDQAQQLGDAALVGQLDRIDGVLKNASNAALLRGMVRATPSTDDAPAGNGVCRGRDFDDPSFERAAEELGIAHLTSDPYARTGTQWELLAVATQLGAAGLPRAAARALMVGKAEDTIVAWLRRGGVTVDFADHGRSANGRYDAVLFWREHGPDRINDTLAAHADATTLAVIVGDVAINGVPTTSTPQPHQLELDLLARARLQPAATLATRPDDDVLEACALTADAEHAPLLCRIAGPQVLTSFVVAAKPRPTRAQRVLRPAAPRAAETLRVGVDLRTLSQADSTARGIGKYTTQHLEALLDVEPGLRLVGYTNRPDAPLPDALRRAEVTTACIDDYRPGDVALLHIPDPMNMSFGFDSPLRVLRHPRTTATFHDLTPLHRYIEHWPRPNREGYLDRLRQIERSDCRLLANSRFTAQDLLAHSCIAPERVTPILAGLHHDGGAPPTAAQIAAVQAQLGITGPFVLHVGALDPHKNFHGALNAFLMARATRPLQLVVVGAIDPGTTQAAALCSSRKIPDVLFTGYLPRAHLDALYASATALLFLSRAEGFGLPILEAMAKGCPVIASDATSHPEVAGDAAILVDPDDQRGAADGIRRLLDDGALRDELRRRGQRQSRAFTWRDVAERTLTVWRGMLEPARAHLFDLSST